MEGLRLLQLPLRRDGLDGHGGAGLQGGRRPVHRQPVAGLYPGRERLPLRQFCTVAVEKVPHGELPASPGRAGRGGCGRPEPTPDGVPGGGLFPHAAEGGGFFRLRAGGHHRIGEPGRAAGHEDQPGPGGGSDPPAGDTAFVREGAPDGRTGDGGVAPVLLKKL